jgi:hypothetical protein
MAQGEIGEQVRRLLQQPDQPLALGTCGEAPSHVVGRRGQQDMAQTHAVGERKRSGFCSK